MCQIDVCTCTRLFETMPGVQPPSRSPTTLSPANHPRRALLFHEAATILTVPHQPLPLPIRSTTDHPHRPSFPPPSPVTRSSPSQLCEHGVTASTIRNAHHHPLLSPITYTVLLSPYVPFSFPFCFHFRLPQTPDPIHPAGKTVRCRKYGNTGAVSQRECDNTKNFD